MKVHSFSSSIIVVAYLVFNIRVFALKLNICKRERQPYVQSAVLFANDREPLAFGEL